MPWLVSAACVDKVEERGKERQIVGRVQVAWSSLRDLV